MILKTHRKTGYHTFGSNLPGRSLGSYRYTFNGKEKDGETAGTTGGTVDYGLRIYNPSLGRFMSVDPLASKYPYLTPFQFASNSPMFQIDVDGAEGEGYLEGALKAATAKLANYATEKITNVVTSAMSSAANYFNDHVEVKFYAKVEVKYTLGSRFSNELLKKGGVVVSADINLSSVELGSLTWEVDLETGKTSNFQINYLNKDGKVVFSQGISGSLSPEITGIGGGANASQTKKDGEVVNETKSANAGAGIAFGNLTATVDQEKDQESGQTKTSGTASGGVSGSYGAAGVIDYNVEVGVKTTIKEDNKDED